MRVQACDADDGVADGVTLLQVRNGLEEGTYTLRETFTPRTEGWRPRIRSWISEQVDSRSAPRELDQGPMRSPLERATEVPPTQVPPTEIPPTKADPIPPTRIPRPRFAHGGPSY